MKTSDATAFPLHWPAHWPRTEYPQRARFDTSQDRAQRGILFELDLMGVSGESIVISTNLELRRDGLPYTRQRYMNDPGVAVYFVRDGQQLCIPCDKWDRIQDNMQAIRKTLEALRGLERWGAKTMVDAAFPGFDALPAQSTPAQSTDGWWVVLGVDRGASFDEVGAAYRRRVKETHPDMGGSAEAFQRVHDAQQEFLKEWEGRKR